uniref:hypothetical protein n=1 Tax=Staphylococcus aureus TaxID=1280 RepID=UPI00301CA0A1
MRILLAGIPLERLGVDQQVCRHAGGGTHGQQAAAGVPVSGRWSPETVRYRAAETRKGNQAVAWFPFLHYPVAEGEGFEPSKPFD